MALSGARRVPGALDALSPWGRCCILALQMRKQAQKNEGSHLGSYSRPVAVGLGLRPRSEDLETYHLPGICSWQLGSDGGSWFLSLSSKEQMGKVALPLTQLSENLALVTPDSAGVQKDSCPWRG